MKHPFIPDIMFGRVFDITPEYLRAAGIRAVVLDIDNTLVTYGMAEPTPEVITWIESLRQNGIEAALASNNKPERVERFNRPLGIFAVPKSRKPSARAVHAACQKFGVTPEEIAVIGDQIFTDVLCARRAGSMAVLVVPLPYPENFFFKCKRLLEKPFIRAYRRRQNKPNQ